MKKIAKISLVALALGLGLNVLTQEPDKKEPIKDVYENLTPSEDFVTDVIIPDTSADKVVDSTTQESSTDKTPQLNTGESNQSENEKDPTEDESNKSEEENNSVIKETEADTIIHFIDSGQSDSILIENDGHFALIDAGDRDDDDLMVNYLKKQGVKTLDYVIMSHYHADHIGGADAVIDTFDVKQAFIPNGDADSQVYRDLIFSLADKKITPSVPLEDKIFTLGDATFEFFNTKGDKNENNNSLVVLLESQNKKALFTGDAEEKIERTLTEIGDVDVFKAGHHGSDTSNTEEFLNQITPEKVVIQVGQDNKHNHPSLEVMQRFEKMGIDVYRNDEQGDIIVTLTAEGITVNQKPGSYKSGEGESDMSVNTEKTPEVEIPQEEYFKNCTELRKKYPDGVSHEHPAYQSKMDRDQDNWACEN